MECVGAVYRTPLPMHDSDSTADETIPGNPNLLRFAWRSTVSGRNRGGTGAVQNRRLRRRGLLSGAALASAVDPRLWENRTARVAGTRPGYRMLAARSTRHFLLDRWVAERIRPSARHRRRRPRDRLTRLQQRTEATPPPPDARDLPEATPVEEPARRAGSVRVRLPAATWSITRR